MFERLESRRLLSSGVGIGHGAKSGADAFGPAEITEANGILTINNAHDVQLSPVYEDNSGPPIEGEVEVIDFAQPMGSIGRDQIFNGVTKVVINGTRDSDIISAAFDGSVSADIFGNGGADEITVSNLGSGAVNIQGGNGNDSIVSHNSGTGTTIVDGGHGKNLVTIIDGLV